MDDGLSLITRQHEFCLKCMFRGILCTFKIAVGLRVTAEFCVFWTCLELAMSWTLIGAKVFREKLLFSRSPCAAIYVTVTACTLMHRYWVQWSYTLSDERLRHIFGTTFCCGCSATSLTRISTSFSWRWIRRIRNTYGKSSQGKLVSW